MKTLLLLVIMLSLNGCAMMAENARREEATRSALIQRYGYDPRPVAPAYQYHYEPRNMNCTTTYGFTNCYKY